MNISILFLAALTIVAPDCPERGDVVRLVVSTDRQLDVPKDAKELLVSFPKPKAKLVEPALRAVAAAGYAPDRLLLMSCRPQILEYLRTKHPECRLVGEFRGWPEAFALAESNRLHAVVVRKVFDREKVDRFHRMGVKFIAGNVNRREEARVCAAMGVDYFETSFPVSVCDPLATVKDFSADPRAVRAPIDGATVVTGGEDAVTLSLQAAYAGIVFTPPATGTVAKVDVLIPEGVANPREGRAPSRPQPRQSAALPCGNGGFVTASPSKPKRSTVTDLCVGDAKIDFKRGFWDSFGPLWSRPDPRNFSAKGQFAKGCEEIQTRYDFFPRPDEKRHFLEFRRRADGTTAVFYNGRCAGPLVYGKRAIQDNVPKAEGLVFRFPTGWKYRVLTDDGAAKDPRYELCDFVKNPAARRFYGWTFANGLSAGLTEVGGVPVKVASPNEAGDVGIAKMGQGEWALEVNPYFSRASLGGFPSEVRFRVPAADYVKAHLLFAIDPNQRKERMMYVRIGRLLGSNGGSSVTQLADTLVACEAATGVPKGAVKIGAIAKDGGKVPVYRLCVPLDVGRIADIAGTADALDFEFLGPVKSGTPSAKRDTSADYEPDNARESAFTIFGATLERTPVTAQFVQAKGAPGNVFAEDEPVESRQTFVDLTAVVPGAVRVAWRATDDGGREVLNGSETATFAAARERKTVTIPLGAAKNVGLYSLDIDVGGLFTHHAKFCLVPPAARRATAKESPFGTGDFLHHAVPTDLDVVLPLHAKAGIPHVGGWAWEKHPNDPRMAAFANSGQFKILSPRAGKFNAKTGTFGVGEAAVVADLERQAAGKPLFTTVLVWHETAPRFDKATLRYGLPQELVGDPVPPRSADEEAAAKYVAECVRIVTKHFPGKRIQIGNSGTSLGALYVPLRGGLDPKLYTCWGTECPGQSWMPERPDGLNAMASVKRAAEKATGHPVALGACHEFTYRTERDLGAATQAAFYMRDVLLCLANGMPMINPANMIDPGNVYHHTFWGASGLCARGPTVYPRLAYLAYAVLTKELDGVTFSRQVETGSPTVYAVEFKRRDSRFVTALWCARGWADLELPSGAAERAVSMRGKALDIRRVAFGEEPSYVTSLKPLADFRISNRRFPTEEAIVRGAQKIPVTLSSVTNAPGWALYNENWRTRTPPHFRPGAFRLKDADGALELTLDTSVTQYVDKTVCENIALAFKEPVTLKPEATTIGLELRGDSNWGQAFFIVEDAKGRTFSSYKHWSECFMSDWRAMTAVNFDGWGFVYQSLTNERQWVGRGTMTPPLKLKAVIVSRFRQPFGLFGYGVPSENPTLAVKSVFVR